MLGPGARGSGHWDRAPGLPEPCPSRKSAMKPATRLGTCPALVLVVLGLLLLLWWQVPPDASGPAMPPWFVDITESAGLDFVHDAGPLDGKYFMPQIVGSGAAIFDFDGD